MARLSLQSFDFPASQGPGAQALERQRPHPSQGLTPELL